MDSSDAENDSGGPNGSSDDSELGDEAPGDWNWRFPHELQVALDSIQEGTAGRSKGQDIEEVQPLPPT